MKTYMKKAFNAAYGNVQFNFEREPDAADVEAAWKAWVGASSAMTPGMQELHDKLLASKVCVTVILPIARAATHAELAEQADKLLAEVKRTHAVTGHFETPAKLIRLTDELADLLKDVADAMLEVTDGPTHDADDDGHVDRQGRVQEEAGVDPRDVEAARARRST